MNELARLSPLTPDPIRASRVRHRCQAELARRATRARRVDAIAGASMRILVPLALGTLSAFYAAALLQATLRVERWLR